jgi:DNA-binding NarL/FixJ family response regulator
MLPRNVTSPNELRRSAVDAPLVSVRVYDADLWTSVAQLWISSLEASGVVVDLPSAQHSIVALGPPGDHADALLVAGDGAKAWTEIIRWTEKAKPAVAIVREVNDEIVKRAYLYGVRIAPPLYAEVAAIGLARALWSVREARSTESLAGRGGTSTRVDLGSVSADLHRASPSDETGDCLGAEERRLFDRVLQLGGTVRQAEILVLYERGHTVAEIEAALKITAATRRTHVTRLLSVLGASNLRDAGRLIRAAAQTSPPPPAAAEQEGSNEAGRPETLRPPFKAR